MALAGSGCCACAECSYNPHLAGFPPCFPAFAHLLGGDETAVPSWGTAERTLCDAGLVQRLSLFQLLAGAGEWVWHLWVLPQAVSSL